MQILVLALLLIGQPKKYTIVVEQVSCITAAEEGATCITRVEFPQPITNDSIACSMEKIWMGDGFLSNLNWTSTEPKIVYVTSLSIAKKSFQGKLTCLAVLTKPRRKPCPPSK